MRLSEADLRRMSHLQSAQVRRLRREAVLSCQGGLQPPNGQERSRSQFDPDVCTWRLVPRNTDFVFRQPLVVMRGDMGLQHLNRVIHFIDQSCQLRVAFDGELRGRDRAKREAAAKDPSCTEVRGRAERAPHP